MSTKISGVFNLIHFEKTDDNAEKQTQLDVSEGKQVMFSLPLIQLQVGDIVKAVGALRCTNNSNGNIAFGGQLILADSDTETEASSYEEMLTNFRGENVSLNVHHGIRDLSGGVIITEDTVNMSYINFIARAQSNQSGDPHLRIDRSYGEMYYQVERDLTS